MRTNDNRRERRATEAPAWRCGAWLCLVSLLAAGPAWAAPVLKEMQPLGGQRGKTFTLTLKGEGLVLGAELVTTLPGTFSRLGPPKDLETPDTQLAFLVELPADIPVGLYPIRVRTDEGLSNLLIFSVSDLPEISEKEPNNSMAEAQLIAAPIAIRGQLPLADQDFYKLTAKAGERLVMEVEARRIGSAIDPVIEVLDSAGRRIAFNDDAPGLGVDARVDVALPKAGTYYIVVHDSKYSEQETTHYRLKVGNWGYAEGIYPLGWQRGKNVEVTFFGGSLAQPVKTHPNLDVPAQRDIVPISLPGPKPRASLPFKFRVSDFPEVLAPSDGSVIELKPSTVVNGCIRKPRQVDRYRFKVSPGEKWMLNLEAASLGTSRLYGSVTIDDSQGRKLAAKDVGHGPDPVLAFTVPDKVSEVTLAVEDVRGQGGPAYAYRLFAEPLAGDFKLKLASSYVNIPAHGTAAVEVVAERHGYDGPVQLSIPDLPEDFTVAGGNIASAETDYYEGRVEPSTLGYLTLTAKPAAKPRALELTVWGVGGTPDHPIRRRAEGPGLMFTVAGEERVNLTGDIFPPKPVTYAGLGLELPVALGKPLPVDLEVAASYVRVPQGLEYPVPWKLVKRGPNIVTVNVTGMPLPSIKDLDLDDPKMTSKGADEGKLMINSKPDTPLVKLDVVPIANLQINGKNETVIAPAVTFEVVRSYTVALSSARLELKSGGKAEVAGSVHREPLFTGTVKIKVPDVPDKISCPDVEVPSDTSEFRLACEAAAGAAEGDFEIHLVATGTIPGRPDKREYTYPPIAARMVVAAEKSTQAANKVGQ